MTDQRALMSGVTTLLLLAACDARVDRPYRGESLLHLEGRVVLADESASESLVPAVAFSTRHGLELVDLSVQGRFPADFRMDLYAPPPASAIDVVRHSADGAEPAEFAIGTITAVPPDHPDELLFSSSEASWQIDRRLTLGFADLPSCVEEPRCARAGEKCEKEPLCQRVELWCLDHTNTECRTVGLPRLEPDGEDVEPLFSEGNELIYTYERAIKRFAGFSERYVIFWTRRGLPKTTPYLAAIGVEEDLKPGYNLIELGEEIGSDRDSDFDSDEDTSSVDDSAQSDTDPCGEEPAPEPPLDSTACIAFDCIELFEAETFARYNERHGTRFRCVAEVDELDFREASEITRELIDIAERLAIARGVSIAELEGTKVIHDPSTKLTIHISPDAEPPIIF